LLFPHSARVQAVVSLGTGTYTFTDRPLLIEKDVVFTRTTGSWVKVVFENTRLEPADVAALLRTTPRPVRAAAAAAAAAAARAGAGATGAGTRAAGAVVADYSRIAAGTAAENDNNNGHVVVDDDDDEKLRCVPCVQLRHAGAKLVNLQVHTGVQCAVLLTAPATAVTSCVLHGGGVVVRTTRRARSAEAALVSVDGNKVLHACNDGIVCEGRATTCQVSE
jgi:hypothetical protein